VLGRVVVGGRGRGRRGRGRAAAARRRRRDVGDVGLRRLARVLGPPPAGELELGQRHGAEAGQIAEQLAAAYAQTRNNAKATEWLNKATAAGNNSATLRQLQQFLLSNSGDFNAIARDAAAAVQAAEQAGRRPAVVSSKPKVMFIQEVVAQMKKGAMTKAAKRHGETPLEYSKEVLAHPEEHTLTTRRRAQFLVNIQKKD
jgi:hypothetical protein